MVREELPIQGEAQRHFISNRFKKDFFAARTTGLPLVEIGMTVAIGTKDNATPVRRPHGIPVVDGIKREPRPDIPRNVANPNIDIARLGVEKIDCEPLPIRR